ncbi:MAG: hypothetical protein Q8R54_02610, partial [Methylobacter sp.]|nr:hypothetical protein [Methylobacter sp.]
EVLKVFRLRLESASDRFETPQPLLDRFTSAVDAVKTHGWSLFRAVDEAHNELCIASAILENQEPKFTCLEYEPPILGCAQSIDFLATAGDLKVYVDVKTIKPLAKDRWEQFEKAQAEEWLPNNVNIMLEKEWQGGELWHNMFAARSRMLEYSLELEQKIAEGNLSEGNSLLVLAFCGEGFYWHQDELEDFVSFYYSGAHRNDDPFSKAEAQHIQDKHISIAKTISRFACMRRLQGNILQKRMNWNVQPLRSPYLS